MLAGLLLIAKILMLVYNETMQLSIVLVAYRENLL